MFTEKQLNQLRELLAPIEKRLGTLEDGQHALEKGQRSLAEQLEVHIQQSKKDHEELGALISGLAEHTDKAIEAAHQKTVDVLTNRMHVTFEHQDKRITRLEKDAGLPPLG